MNYKEKLLSLPNRLNVVSPIGTIENLHRTVKLFDENKTEDNKRLKELYLNYETLKTRSKRK
jgi:hypothetical protein